MPGWGLKCAKMVVNGREAPRCVWEERRQSVHGRRGRGGPTGGGEWEGVGMGMGMGMGGGSDIFSCESWWCMLTGGRRGARVVCVVGVHMPS